LIKRRFEDALKKLESDLDIRLTQRERLTQEYHAKIQARAQIEEDSINVGVNTGGRFEEEAVEEEEEEEEENMEEEPPSAPSLAVPIQTVMPVPSPGIPMTPVRKQP